MSHIVSDIAFTPMVKTIQTRKGSRENYAKMEQKGGGQKEITEDLAAVSNQRTASRDALTWPGRPAWPC